MSSPPPAPSIEMNVLMRSLYGPLRNRNFMPRRSPSPSSPTSPTKRMSLFVWIPAASIARMIASRTASERVSSPMPAPARRVREPGGAQHLEILRAALILLDRRRGNLRELDDLRDQPIVVLVERRHGRLEFRIVGDALDGIVGCGLGPGKRARETEQPGAASRQANHGTTLLQLRGPVEND